MVRLRIARALQMTCSLLIMVSIIAIIVAYCFLR